MIKGKALNKIEQVHGKGPEYQIIDRLYSENEDIPDQVVESLTEPRVKQEYTMVCGSAFAQEFDRIIKEYVGKL